MNKFNITNNYDEYKQIFLEENSKLNLISKNEEKYLYEKHIYDSLGIKLFIDKTPNITSILDIGTGGGFPSIPIAMEYPHINVTAIDSRGKKIKAVSNIAKKLNLNNLELINDRVENLTNRTFDVITSRAVGKIDLLIEYAYPLLKDKGFIVLYKSMGVNNELDNAKPLIRKYKLKIHPLIEYKLPLENNFERYLVIFQK